MARASLAAFISARSLRNSCRCSAPSEQACSKESIKPFMRARRAARISDSDGGVKFQLDDAQLAFES